MSGSIKMTKNLNNSTEYGRIIYMPTLLLKVEKTNDVVNNWNINMRVNAYICSRTAFSMQYKISHKA